MERGRERREGEREGREKEREGGREREREREGGGGGTKYQIFFILWPYFLGAPQVQSRVITRN